jgi:uncharacterized iron-regulated membrane protein
MSATRVASIVHKWLALVLLVPVLFWFVSGLFFAVAPIETVRSEHRIAKQPPAPVAVETAALGLARISGQVRAAEKIEVRMLLGRPVAAVVAGKGRPKLFDLGSGRPISPIDPATAAAIAERDLSGDEKSRRVERVTKNSPEYRGPLPAWRVDFAGANRSVYVAADTGLVTSRRSTLWRVFDFMWALHILDFEEHEDINNSLLIGTSALGLVIVVTGIILFPSRLGYNAWRRRRRRRREA